MRRKVQHFVTSKHFQPGLPDEELTAILLTQSSNQIQAHKPHKPDKDTPHAAALRAKDKPLLNGAQHAGADPAAQSLAEKQVGAQSLAEGRQFQQNGAASASGAPVSKAQAKQLQRQQFLEMAQQEQILLQKRLHSMRQDSGKAASALELNGESSKIKINYATPGGKAHKAPAKNTTAQPK